MGPSRRNTAGPNSDNGCDSHWATLVAEARAGSVEAQGRLLDSCRGYLLAVAARDLGHELAGKAGASDVVQDTFAAAHEHFGRFTGTSEQELLAWLCAILGHKIVSTQRRFLVASKRDARRELPIDLGTSSVIGGPLLVSDSSSPSANAIRAEESQRVAALLKKLPDEYRRAILMRNWERRSFEEIGQILECSPNAARKLWLRALARLEDLMAAGPLDAAAS